MGGGWESETDVCHIMDQDFQDILGVMNSSGKTYDNWNISILITGESDIYDYW